MGAVTLPIGGYDLAACAKERGANRHEMTLLVDGVHCGGCIAKIEGALKTMPGVEQARVNLSTSRLTVAWAGAADQADAIGAKVTALGFGIAPLADQDEAADGAETPLLRALAVSGFATANVMLLSVSIWAGHAQGMDAAVRDLLHWFSALVALPAVAYAGQPFFRSAFKALSGGTMNMDVPISLAVLLACGLSLRETMVGGPHAYFDSAITLVFFLLIGRYLDRRARGKARAAAQSLVALGRRAVTVLEPDGSTRRVMAQAVRPGMTLLVAAGEHVGADGTIIEGRSDIDASLVTGETLPQAVAAGSAVHAGSVNGAGVLQLHVDKAGDETLVSEIIRLMEAAEGAKSKMVDLADKVARAYAPVVHIAALATFVGWLLLGPGGWEPALRNAVAVLIITCPCALALAVPAVQVIASGALMRRGILLKSATALERVGKVDTVVFDKTGTLTVGRPVLVEPDRYDGQDLRQSAALAANSRHPLARALVEAVGEVVPAPDVIEQPGLGLEQGDTRLGSAEWNGIKVSERVSDSRMELWMTRPGKAPVRFSFIDTPRDDAASTIAALHRGGMETRLLSGDRPVVAETIAKALGIIRWRGGQRPDEKVAEIAGLESDGRCVMMIGDGLNDAAALTSASVSMSPSSAAEISQNAADIVFQGDRLAPVLYILDIAKRVDRLTKQNFALAIGYNVITIPLAMAGLITPLIAALAMSSSSILVVLNALRLGHWKPAGETR